MNSFQNSQKFIHILSAAKAMHPTSLQFLHFLPPTTISATKTMKTLINPTSLSSPNPQNLLSTRISIYSPTSIQSFKRSPSISRTLIVKCSSEMRDNGGLKDLLSGIVDKGVEELLNKEENKELLDGLEKASLRVEMAKKELDDYKRKELEAAKMRSFVNNLGNKTSEITELQREILEARSMIEEAERSLSSEMDGVSLEENGKEGINKDDERLESIKAASIAAVIGTLAGLPISLSQVTSSTELILPSAITFISCALFGVTFRYIIRRDLDDVHLKSGAAGAFAVVKGLAALEAGPRLELDSASFLSHAIDGAVYVSENLFIFIFASVGLDFFFKMRLLSPFPIKRSGANKAE